MQRRIKRKWLLLIALLAVLAGCASFEGAIPIEYSGTDIFYISPKNADGIQDSLAVPVRFPHMKGLVIRSWEFSIRRDNGTIVFRMSDEGRRPPWYKRLFGARPAAGLPETLVWDGRDGDGAFVADGVYFLTAEAFDAAGNSGRLGPITVVVDDTPPTSTVMIPYSVFSPNGDGNQDNLDIYFRDSSQENSWEGILTLKAGSPVYTLEWQGVPHDFSWKGDDATGKLLDDGELSFILTATDPAGNSFRFQSGPLLKDSTIPPISARLSGTLISPNGDGEKDTVDLILEAQNPDRITAAKVTVISPSGEAVMTLPTPAAYPAVIPFSGFRDGQPLPDGLYYLQFAVGYRNGARPEVITPALKIDTAAPYAVLSTDYLVFSPDGDGRRDSIPLHQSTESAQSWTGSLRDQDGRTVFSREWGTRAVGTEWDGRDPSGKTVPDGSYTYQLRGVDEAGNVTVKTVTGIRVDTRPTPAALHLMDTGFSPNGDGITENARFTPEIAIHDGISAWTFEVLNSAAEMVYRIIGTSYSDLPRTIPWNGANAPEGPYRGRLSLQYEKGNQVSALTPGTVMLDLTGPKITASVGQLPFSPDGDGTSDRLTIRIRTEDPAGVTAVKAVILDPVGNLFFTLPESAFTASGTVWNGTSAAGELVQSASDYTLRTIATDLLGNESVNEITIPVDILVIRDGERLRISISSIYFKPNTADYLGVEAETARKNLATLDRLAEILEKYSAYSIKLEGHGVRIYWDQPKRWPAEETEVLVPLSRDRAEAIKAALTSRGIDPERMTTEGFGGYRPVVPHGDLDNRWKNRRVEFILIK